MNYNIEMSCGIIYKSNCEQNKEKGLLRVVADKYLCGYGWY